jgi:hypothetical protein
MTATVQEQQAEFEKLTQTKKVLHWVDGQKNRNKFWAKANDLGYNKDDAYSALGVQHIHDFKGTLGEALTLLVNYVPPVNDKQDDVFTELDDEHAGVTTVDESQGGNGAEPDPDIVDVEPQRRAVVSANAGLSVYGNRSEVKELSDRIGKMLPSVRELGNAGALALAQVAFSMGLNPFTGEIWAIPQKKNGKVVGFSIMAGIKGLRRAARKQSEKMGGVYPFYRPRFRMLSEEEKEMAELGEKDRGLICELELILPPSHPFFKPGYERFIIEGIGIVRANERSMMERIQLLRKRAEADALKMAFDLPFGDSGDGFAIEAEYTVNGH